MYLRLSPWTHAHCFQLSKQEPRGPREVRGEPGEKSRGSQAELSVAQDRCECWAGSSRVGCVKLLSLVGLPYASPNPGSVSPCSVLAVTAPIPWGGRGPMGCVVFVPCLPSLERVPSGTAALQMPPRAPGWWNGSVCVPGVCYKSSARWWQNAEWQNAEGKD